MRLFRVYIGALEKEREKIAHVLANGLEHDEYQRGVGKYRQLGADIAKAKALLQRAEPEDEGEEFEDPEMEPVAPLDEPTERRRVRRNFKASRGWGGGQ